MATRDHRGPQGITYGHSFAVAWLVTAFQCSFGVDHVRTRERDRVAGRKPRDERTYRHEGSPVVTGDHVWSLICAIAINGAPRALALWQRGGFLAVLTRRFRGCRLAVMRVNSMVACRRQRPQLNVRAAWGPARERAGLVVSQGAHGAREHLGTWDHRWSTGSRQSVASRGQVVTYGHRPRCENVSDLQERTRAVRESGSMRTLVRRSKVRMRPRARCIRIGCVRSHARCQRSVRDVGGYRVPVWPLPFA